MNGYKFWMSVVAGALFIGISVNPTLADVDATEATERIDSEASVTLGYRGTSIDDNGGRAREYDSFDSNPLFNLKLFTDRGGYHLDFSGEYLNDDDYSAEAHLDTEGLVRIDLRTIRFFHNLDHIPYDNGYAGGEAYPPPATPPGHGPPPGQDPGRSPGRGESPRCHAQQRLPCLLHRPQPC